MSETPRAPRILCVDDEPHIVAGLKVLLERRYEVHTALGGAQGLEVLRREGPFAVVLSDMRMPAMSGAAFLGRVQQIAPETVRMLLTGHAGIDEAIAAVNEGYIFRFLTKPCPQPLLLKAVGDAIEQHRLITADKLLLEQKLDRLSAQLLHAERLATLGTLANGVGHELKNIAAVFLGTLRFLGERAAQGLPPEDEDLAELKRVGAHLELHAQHLLHLGRPKKDATVDIDLRDIAAGTVSMLQAVGKTKYVEVESVLPPDPVLIHVSRTRIEQVLINLIGNAADALVESSGEKRLRILVEREGDLARCTVEDSGCGIPEEKLAMVFEPYFTTKSPERGTGLGLPVVKQIVESYGGTISVKSTVGVGSAFTFSIPISKLT